MAFADPSVLTINAVPFSLARVGFGANSGTFQNDLGTHKLTFDHAYNKRSRRRARVDIKKSAADVMDSSLTVPYSMSISLLLDVPTVGYTITEQKQNVEGFLALLTATSGANLVKLLGGES